MPTCLDEYEFPDQALGHRSSSVSYRSSNSSLLALPRYLDDGCPAPFKAQALDDSSLTMKRRHHRMHSYDLDMDGIPPDCNGEALGVPDIGPHRSPRSSSLPCLRGRPISPGKGEHVKVMSKSALTSAYERRWTLPIKASSTQETAVVGPVFKHVSKRRQQRPAHSPAVITLRRATNNLCQNTGITFFPHPRLNTSNDSLIDIFIRKIAGQGQQLRTSSSLVENKTSRVAGVLPGKGASDQTVEAESGNAAYPATTQVTFAPTVSLPFSEVDVFRRRRCSTKYVTRSSIYEIIWDENDTPTPGSKSSPLLGPATDLATRRPSVAATYLEAQLCKSVAQSRRTSTPVPRYDPSRSISISNRKKSFGSMLDFSLSRMINESALRNLPRSRASRGEAKTISDFLNEGLPYRTVSETFNSLPLKAVEVFPPLPQHYDSADVSMKKTTLQPAPSEACGVAEGGSGFMSKRNETDLGDVGTNRRRRARHEGDDETIPMLSKHC